MASAERGCSIRWEGLEGRQVSMQGLEHAGLQGTA